MRTRILLPVALAALILLPLACTPDPVEGQNPGECVDGADNDEDGLFDCADPDCVPAPACAGDDDDTGDDDTGDDDTGDDDAGDDDTLHDDDDDHGDDDSAVGPGDDDSSVGPGDDDDTANPGEWQNPGDCSDGIDNDGDTLIDCKDPDCGNESSECGGDDDDDDSAVGGDDDDSAVGGDDDDSTSPLVEDCSNGIDDDGDGSADCQDADCTGDPGCGSAFTGPTIETAGPCAIDASTTSSCAMTVGNPDDTSVDHISPGDIGLMVVVVDITHPAVGELTLNLIGDGGTVVLVTAGVVSGANFTGTVFIDNMSCGGSCPEISQGNAPFTGDHSPEESLSSMTGFNINGPWTLSVVNTGTTAGTIDTWSIGANLQ